ncbi:MAG: coenzyme F420-0:L-glutamate ligase [Thermoproteota archaeon]|nr:coenzyme F420-0:L-glutamate ligase [Thermoproteota archaeon]
MQIFAIKSPLIKPKDDLVATLLQAVQKAGLKLGNKDVLAVSSKAVASAEGRLVKLKDVKPSDKAKRLAGKFLLTPKFVEVVLREADKVYGGVEKALLTLKNNVFTVNAGVDHKNAPIGFAASWPSNPNGSAEKIRKEIRRRNGKDVGVLIVDSTVTPLRMGTVGLALGVAGFKPVKDCRGDKDLFKKRLLITQHAVADDLASAAHLIMGEGDEGVPFVLIKGAPVSFMGKVNGEEMKISPDQCVYAKVFLSKSSAS